MLQVGKTDAFERMYTQKFRAFAGAFGEFISYERDRGARDIGLHLTHKLRSGAERISSALCWFQLKGIMATTLSSEDFLKRSAIEISLKVQHLRYWYLQPMPTYLALYVESADTFLVLNLQKYVADRWERSIFEVNQKEVTIEVPSSSVLDEQAFNLILADNDIQEWVRALGAEDSDVRLCRRDYDLIWHIGTASKRQVEHRIRIVDWQSKMRGEVYIQERPTSGDLKWTDLRAHWQLGLSAHDIEKMYPYLELYSTNDEIVDEDEDEPLLELSNGEVVQGIDCAGEYFEFTLGSRLNSLGNRLFESVENLGRIGLLEINEGMSEFIDIAPWNRRSV